MLKGYSSAYNLTLVFHRLVTLLSCWNQSVINCCMEKMRLVEHLVNSRLGVLISLFLFRHRVVVPPRGSKSCCVLLAVC